MMNLPKFWQTWQLRLYRKSITTFLFSMGHPVYYYIKTLIGFHAQCTISKLQCSSYWQLNVALSKIIYNYLLCVRTWNFGTYCIKNSLTRINRCSTPLKKIIYRVCQHLEFRNSLYKNSWHQLIEHENLGYGSGIGFNRSLRVFWLHWLEVATLSTYNMNETMQFLFRVLSSIQKCNNIQGVPLKIRKLLITYGINGCVMSIDIFSLKSSLLVIPINQFSQILSKLFPISSSWKTLCIHRLCLLHCVHHLELWNTNKFVIFDFWNSQNF